LRYRFVIGRVAPGRHAAETCETYFLGLPADPGRVRNASTPDMSLETSRVHADAAPAPGLDGHSGANDPYLAPNNPAGVRARRALWRAAEVLLFRPSPRVLHAWRAWLLRLFGASLGPHCHIYPGASIWAPWNLVCEDCVAIADGAIVYNPSRVTLGSHAVVSQQAYLCGATHDFDAPAFPQVSAPITVGRYAWICARASVLPGVTVGDGAVLGLGSIATRDLEAGWVHAGQPARRVRRRKAHE
jgi:putative colanic acid biosynthesis acetyltransferase WcaF